MFRITRPCCCSLQDFILSFIGVIIILLHRHMFHWCCSVYLGNFALFLKVVTRQVPLMELLTRLEHPRSSLFYLGFHRAIFSYLFGCVNFCRFIIFFWLLYFLSFFDLQFMIPLGIFKLFLYSSLSVAFYPFKEFCLLISKFSFTVPGPDV